MRFRFRFGAPLAAACCCALAMQSVRGSAAEADFVRCKTADEPNVICFNGVGDWGCNGPCPGAKQYGPVTIFKVPAGYQLCRSFMTRRDIQGGECHFTGGPTELQLACNAPGASARARVHEITVYLISPSAAASKQLSARYECIRW